MTDESSLQDVYWRMYDDNIAQCRHHETQRTTVVSATLAISAALVGIATLDDTLRGVVDAAVSLLLVCLGLFGAGFSLKQYERYNFHMSRARSFRRAIDDQLGSCPIEAINDDADRVHQQKFRRLRKVRLHHWWVSLNLFVSAIGVVLLFVSLRQP